MLHQDTVLLSGVPGYGFIFYQHGDHELNGGWTSERDSMKPCMISVQKGKKREVWIRISELPRLSFKRYTCPSTKTAMAEWLHCLLERSVPGTGGSHNGRLCLAVLTVPVHGGEQNHCLFPLGLLCWCCALTQNARRHWGARTRSLTVKIIPPWSKKSCCCKNRISITYHYGSACPSYWHASMSLLTLKSRKAVFGVGARNHLMPWPHINLSLSLEGLILKKP